MDFESTLHPLDVKFKKIKFRHRPLAALLQYFDWAPFHPPPPICYRITFGNKLCKLHDYKSHIIGRVLKTAPKIPLMAFTLNFRKTNLELLYLKFSS